MKQSKDYWAFWYKPLNEALLTCQKLLKAQGDISVTIVIVPLKHICHPLQYYAALNKKIKAHAVSAAFVVGSK